MIEKFLALVKIGEQTAHDINSTLVVLDMIAYNCNNLSDEERALIKKTISRITEITNNLLTHQLQQD